jgi:adenylate cyclase
MSEPVDISRKLVAVFAADVDGDSRLMGADEVGTLKGLTERRATLDRIIGDQRGREYGGRQCPCRIWKCG